MLASQFEHGLVPPPEQRRARLRRARRFWAVSVVEQIAKLVAVLSFAGTEIVARMDAASRSPVGAPAEFSFDLRNACLFDAATGQRFA